MMELRDAALHIAHSIVVVCLAISCAISQHTAVAFNAPRVWCRSFVALCARLVCLHACFVFCEIRELLATPPTIHPQRTEVRRHSIRPF